MLHDFHLHTIVSDGELRPDALLAEAARRGVTHASITDHDAIGAYLWRDGGVFEAARRTGIELTVGIEMDADLDGQEVHVLGYDISLDSRPLRRHLDHVRHARFERARREIGIVNERLGDGSIHESEIFVEGRETLMKPHFIHPLLDKGRFATYEEANAWYRANVKSGVSVPKPEIGQAIELIHHAGGWASLAHPGYYERDGQPITGRLEALHALGLDAIELSYPYAACSPHLFSAEREREYIDGLRRAAEPLGFRFTRGSDCHTVGDFEKVYGSRS